MRIRHDDRPVADGESSAEELELRRARALERADRDHGSADALDRGESVGGDAGPAASNAGNSSSVGNARRAAWRTNHVDAAMAASYIGFDDARSRTSATARRRGCRTDAIHGRTAASRASRSLASLGYGGIPPISVDRRLAGIVRGGDQRDSAPVVREQPAQVRESAADVFVDIVGIAHVEALARYPGTSCIRPRASWTERALGSKLDSTAITASANRGSTP